MHSTEPLQQTLTADMMLGAYRAMRQTQELQSTPISIDTFDAEVAAQAVAAGAHIVNDVSGGTMDPNMHAQVHTSAGCRLCVIPTSCLAWRTGCTQIAHRLYKASMYLTQPPCRLSTSSTRRRYGHASDSGCTPQDRLSGRLYLSHSYPLDHLVPYLHLY